MPCADSSTICARRHVPTDPDARRTIRSSRLPSSLVISRNCTLAAIAPPGRVAISTQGLRRQHHHPWLWKPANIAGEPTSSRGTERLTGKQDHTPEGVARGIPRRGVPSGAAMLGVGAGLDHIIAKSPHQTTLSGADPSGNVVPFYGAHQAGVATAAQDYLSFA